MTTLQDLEEDLTYALIKYGLTEKNAHTLSREVAVRARKRLHPTKKFIPVTIEDDYHAGGTIRILIRKGNPLADPVTILKNYVAKRPKYPSLEKWVIEEAFGAPNAIRKVYHATLMTKEAKKLPKAVNKLTPKEAKELVEKLNTIYDLK
jgi:hypothetical protein